jgi:hypothetical protein
MVPAHRLRFGTACIGLSGAVNAGEAGRPTGGSEATGERPAKYTASPPFWLMRFARACRTINVT